MKVFYTILALYMMALFITPCADLYKKDLSQDRNNSTQIVHQNNYNHQEATDFCTPFCLCDCCGTMSSVDIQWNVFTIDKIDSFTSSKVYYKPVFIPRYFGKIWQPPQINA
jgi:hypothetical protein